MSTITIRQETTPGRLVRPVPMLGPAELRDLRLPLAGDGVSLLGATPTYLLVGGLILAAVAAAFIGGASAAVDGKESMS